MTAAVSAINTGASPNAALEAQTHGTQQHSESQKTTETPKDTAALSITARTLQLFEQGESVSAIAFILGISVDTVDSYLHISPPTSPTSASDASSTALQAKA
jgi:DNA-binding NarL/FixJ family response regulator